MTIKTIDTMDASIATTYKPDLESRIKAHRAELMTKLAVLRANKRLIASEAGNQLRAKLAELSRIIKEEVVDGWASLGDPAKHRLEQWFAESLRHPDEVPATPRS